MTKKGLFFAALAAATLGAAAPRAEAAGYDCVQTPAPQQLPRTLGVSGSPFKVQFRTPSEEQRFVASPLGDILLRMAVSLQQDVFVNSGYRSCRHNAKVGGVSRSNHLRGIAVDFSVAPNEHTPANMRRSYSSRELQQIALRLGARGAGAYCGKFAHLDFGNPRTWNWCKGK